MTTEWVARGISNKGRPRDVARTAYPRMPQEVSSSGLSRGSIAQHIAQSEEYEPGVQLRLRPALKALAGAW
jgi:hypothetical protein